MCTVYVIAKDGTRADIRPVPSDFIGNETTYAEQALSRARRRQHQDRRIPKRLRRRG